MSKFTKCDKLFSVYVRAKRGYVCQICGKKDNRCGIFHILPKSTYPRLRYREENVLVVCWFPCHNDWHHNYYKAEAIAMKIIRLLGSDYKERLKVLNKTAPKVDSLYLGALEEWLRKEEYDNQVDPRTRKANTCLYREVD